MSDTSSDEARDRRSPKGQPEERSELPPQQSSVEPQAQPQSQRKASQSRRRGRSHTRRSPSVSTMSDAGPEDNGDKRRKRKNKKRQNALPAVDEVESTGKEVAETAGGAVQSVGNTAGAVAQGGGGGGGSDKPLKLRLDLNLDADIRLTAKVHGDITLSLL